MSRILVHGAAGLLGAAAGHALLDAGDEVVAVDGPDAAGEDRESRASRLASLAARGATVRRLDATDAAAVESLVATHRPIAILSAEPRGRWTATLLRAAESGALKFFVLLSSAALYGAGADPGAPASEDEPVDPRDDAGRADLARDEALVLAARLPAVVLRLGETLAPPPATAFPADAAAALRGNEEVFLEDDEPGDFLPLDAAARAVAAVFAAPPAHRILNVGSGRATRPSAIVEALARALGVSPRLVILPPAAGRPPKRVLDVGRARPALPLPASIDLDAWASAYVGVARGPTPPPEASSPLGARPAAASGKVSRRALFSMFRRT